MDQISGVILAAGQSRRLRPLTNDRPKCMLPVGNKLIIDWQLQSLESIGVKQIFIAVGYRKEMIQTYVEQHYPHLDVQYVVNDRYTSTNTLFSLKRILECYAGNFYYLNADVMFDVEILKRLANETGSGGFLAIERKACGEEEVKVRIQNQSVVEIGKHLDPEKSAGEFIGLAKFTGPFAQQFRRCVFEQAIAGNEMNFFEHALNTLVDKTALFAVDITGYECMEIDYPEDYQQALSKFSHKETSICTSSNK